MLAGGALFKINYALFAVKNASDQFRQPVRSARSRNQIHRRAVIENGLAFQLRHATHNAHDGFPAEPLPADFPDASKNLMRRPFPD